MVNLLLGLAKSARFWAILGALGALGGGLVWAYNEVYRAGYRAAELELRKEQIRLIESAVAEARNEWIQAAAAAADNAEREAEIVERIRIVEREVPRIVERTVPATCHDLGPDVLRVFNEAILAGGDTEGGGAGAPADTGS